MSKVLLRIQLDFKKKIHQKTKATILHWMENQLIYTYRWINTEIPFCPTWMFDTSFKILKKSWTKLILYDLLSPELLINLLDWLIGLYMALNYTAQILSFSELSLNIK